ncbi:MAG: Gfo/Idh/MocA family oxidoreductase [Isosphaeraceae bacterium]
MLSRRVNRRDVLRAGGLSLAGSLSSAAGLGCARSSANDRLNIGVIGVAGRGAVNLACVASQNVVALCDVDEKHLAQAAEKFPRAYTYHDFRKMLEWKAIDAVVITTPDHTHAPATAMALRLGKHVYCEKPLTHTVHEARETRKLAAGRNLATQMGIQMHRNYRRAVQLIRDGKLGPVAEVHAWTDRPVWAIPKGRYKYSSPAPAYLHWDLWLGPAPEREYQSGYQPFSWRAWWDFGTGALGDAACHILDPAFSALDLGLPDVVEAEGPTPHPEVCPKGLLVHYTFPARGTLPPVKLTWYEGGLLPPRGLTGNQALPDNGLLFIGPEGKLLVQHYTGDHWLITPQGVEPLPLADGLKPDSPDHHLEWIRACKQGGATSCDFGRAATLTEAILLGNVAYRAEKPLRWDAPNMRAIDCPGADQYLRVEYRKGWTL